MTMRPTTRKWIRALRDVMAWTLAVLIVGGVVRGFQKQREEEAAARARAAQEERDREAPAHRSAFQPEVIDPEGVLDYAESQRTRLEILADALSAYLRVHGILPVGDKWQELLVAERFLPAIVTLDTLPLDVTWNRTPPPSPELVPGLDTTGILTMTLRAGGIDLATWRGLANGEPSHGEIVAVEQPVPPDAALPPAVAQPPAP